MQYASGKLLQPVQKLVATSIFCNAENGNKSLLILRQIRTVIRIRECLDNGSLLRYRCSFSANSIEKPSVGVYSLADGF